MKNPCNNPKGVQGSKDAPTAPKELKVVVVVVVVGEKKDQQSDLRNTMYPKGGRPQRRSGNEKWKL